MDISSKREGAEDDTKANLQFFFLWLLALVMNFFVVDKPYIYLAALVMWESGLNSAVQEYAQRAATQVREGPMENKSTETWLANTSDSYFKVDPLHTQISLTISKNVTRGSEPFVLPKEQIPKFAYSGNLLRVLAMPLM